MLCRGKSNLCLGNNAKIKKDGLCYTEDDVLVYNLYIARIPNNITEDDIKMYFSKYGDILSVTVEVKENIKDKSIFRYGFVNFKSAKSAAEALKYRVRVQAICRDIVMKPADSWMQPSALEQNIEKTQSLTVQDSEENDVEENLILNLNDDCLIHIFSFLSLKEQIKLSLLCERFQNILQMVHRKSKSFNVPSLGENLTLMETRELVSQVGDYIEEIHLHSNCVSSQQRKLNYSRFLEAILSSCSNLRWLEITSITGIHLNIYTLLSAKLKFLTKVEFRSCALIDDIIFHLSKLPALDDLDISGNYSLTGKFLSDCPKLTQLNLKGCISIQPGYFNDLCKKGRLKSLNIRDCYKLNKYSFEEMESALESLTDLVLSTSYTTLDLCNIAGLRNLERLKIYSDGNVRNIENLFEYLVTKKENTLQELMLYYVNLNKLQRDCICSLRGLKNLGLFKIGLDDEFLQKIATLPNLENLSLIRCSAFTQMGIASFFATSNNLQSIDISYSNNINIETLYYILDKVKKSNRSSPCTLYVFETAIRESVLLDKNYLDCASVLPILFEKNKFTKKFLCF